MRTPGELVTDDPWAFAFRVLEPAPDTPLRLLVLLHGVDGDEMQWAGLGARVDAQTHVVLPRGPRSIAGGRWGWFREGRDENLEPQVVADEARESCAKLIEFIGQLRQRHALPAAACVIGGFSQGAMLCAGAALQAPDLVAGLAMVGGRLLPELDANAADRGDAASLRVLVAHNDDDDVVPHAQACHAAAHLRARGASVVMRTHAEGHALTPALEQDVLAWWQREFCPVTQGAGEAGPGGSPPDAEDGAVARRRSRPGARGR
jgi:phospholipase/carboxylesterase